MKQIVTRIVRPAVFFAALLCALQLFVGFPDAAIATNCAFNNPNDPLGVDCVGGTGLNNEDPRIIIGRIIQVALGLIGIIVVVLIIWAGFRWMTAAGREGEIEEAKKTLGAAVIGLVIILMAYSITTFVIGELFNATTGRKLY
jgi:hypothetical protein